MKQTKKCHVCDAKITDKDVVVINAKKHIRCPKCKTILPDENGEIIW